MARPTGLIRRLRLLTLRAAIAAQFRLSADCVALGSTL